MGPDDRAVVLTTTLRNRGATPTEVGLGDAIQWSGAEHWVPGLGFRPPRTSEEPYIAGVGQQSAYAYFADHPLVGPNGSNWSNPTQGDATLAPGESRTYVRRMGVASTPDVERALEAAGRLAPSASLTVHVHDADGLAVAGTRIVLHDREINGPPRALASTDARGDARLAVDAGSYAIEVTAAGRIADAATRALLLAPISLASNARARVELVLGPPASLTVSLHEGAQPLPGRAIITGIDETPNPMFGGVGHADGARNSNESPRLALFECRASCCMAQR